MRLLHIRADVRGLLPTTGPSEPSREWRGRRPQQLVRDVAWREPGTSAAPRAAGDHADSGRKSEECVHALTMATGAVLTALDIRGLAVSAAFMVRTAACDGPAFVDLQRHLKDSRFALALAAEGLRRPSPLQGQHDEQQDGERPVHDGEASDIQQLTVNRG